LKNNIFHILLFLFYYDTHIASFIRGDIVDAMVAKKPSIKKVGENTKDSFIGMGCFIMGNLIEIEDNTVINRFTYLDGRVSLKIGNNVNISKKLNTFLYLDKYAFLPDKTNYVFLRKST